MGDVDKEIAALRKQIEQLEEELYALRSLLSQLVRYS
jgi:chaperonin cofactor prefoldin